MRKIILTILILCLNFSVFCIDISSLNKYEWVEKFQNTRGGYTHFYKITEIPENYAFYKMKFYSKKSSSPFFFVFLYNSEKKKFSEIDRINYSWSKLPLFEYDFKGFEAYEKNEENSEEIDGKYFSETEVIYEFEIRKIKEQQYLYAVSLDYEQVGQHLLYLKDDVLKSDGTFGYCDEESLEKLFEMDRSESFYDSRNILSAYTDDDFTISIIENEDFNVKLELESNLHKIPLVPSALYECNTYYICQGTEIFDENLNVIKKEQQTEEKVKFIQKKYEWIERNGLFNLFIEIQLEDGSTGWVYSDSLIIF